MTKRRRYALTFLVIAIGIGGATSSFSQSPRSQCSASLGKLNIAYVIQQKSNWCWVATVSEVLKWFELPNSDQCQLYDLVYETNSCNGSTGNDRVGSPDLAVDKYKGKHGGITYVVRHHDDQDQPLTFEAIQERICPKSGGEGEPFIWAYDNWTSGNPDADYHDVVVYGYSLITDENGGQHQLLYVDDPNSPSLSLLEPNVFEYASYADRSAWVEDVLISKLHEHP